MKEYDIVAIFWDDHYHVTRSRLINDASDILPTLSLGIIVKETSRHIWLLSDLERYETRDEATYTIILKSTIVATEKYGKIKLNKLKFLEGAG